MGMIETIAHSLFETDSIIYGGFAIEWSDIGDYRKRLYFKRARTAIAAMREPSTRMISKANRLNHPSDTEVWQTMIDEALREPD